ncbi:MAG TPA: hypothetical protein VFI27_17715 [candidate division Zixibacteria bacterium]|nr:hypothetical protein [candidate division Zixibacteria bacterium]
MQPDKRTLIRNFALELVVYGILVTIYFFVVLRSLGPWLADLYNSNLTIYAIAALAVIVIQSVFLEVITSFLIERLGLERLE